jgi:hypothetical protein
VEKAIAENTGEVVFYLNEKESVRSTIRSGHAELATSLGKPPTESIVPSTTFSALIEEFGVPYYMKVDIEGADLLCLEGLVPFAERPIFISTEIPISLAEQINELLLFRKLGYECFQLIDQMSVPSQVPPWPAREGQYVDDQFEIMCSGLFGEELEGAWLTLGGAISRYLMLFARNKRMGLLVLLCHKHLR